MIMHINRSNRPIIVLSTIIGGTLLFWMLYSSSLYPMTNSVNVKELLSGPNYLPQDDPALVEYIRSRLNPPSTEPYELKVYNNPNPSEGQSSVIIEILKNKQNGFYVDCGAFDGEEASNSLVFELNYNWSGLLIEADPRNFAKLQGKHRRAWTLNACLNTKAYGSKEVFEVAPNPQTSLIKEKNLFHPQSSVYEVECFPLYSMLLALNVTTVDFFSLDVQGAEMGILDTIPWDIIDIKTLSIENDVIGEEAIKTYMLAKGYIYHGVSVRDSIFKKPGV